MKRILTFSMMLMLAVGTMLAWQTSDTEAIRLDAEGSNGQVQMKTLTTPEGKIILSWLRGELVDGVFGYRLHLQVFDAEGNAQFGDEGIVVCDKATWTYTTDYALAMASNGDILLGYHDIRNDMENQENSEVYVYRYTQQGEPVWDVDGVLFPAGKLHENALLAENINPVICVSGDNIFVAAVHNEYYNEEANEDNWSPSPWFPNQEMPDSVLVTDSRWLIMLAGADGTMDAVDPMTLPSKILLMRPAPEGSVYAIYNNEDFGLNAQRLDNSLTNLWGEPVVVEPEPLTSGMYMPSPLAELDADGGLVLSYRKLLDWSGYQVLNYLSPDGDFLPEPTSCNNTTDGDASVAVMTVKDYQAFVAWEYTDVEGKENMYVNSLDTYGGFLWMGEDIYGKSLDKDDMWGFKPVKVIPQTDGWVLLYGNLQSWNGANFMVVKMDDMGTVMWTKQICEDNFKSSGFEVAYDENHAYVFYTQDEEYDDNWEVIPGSGGMYVMCIDISGGETSIDEIDVARANTTKIYTIEGRRVNKMENGNIYIVRTTDAQGHVTTTKVKK